MLRATNVVGFSAACTILAFPIGGEVFAQSTLSPMPVTSSIDENGVDVVNSQYSHEIGTISIGPDGQDPLSISLHLPTERDSLTSNLRIQDPSGYTSSRSVVSLGPKSWLFFGTSGLTDLATSVSILYGFNTAEMVARDGSVISFDFPNWLFEGTAGPVNLCASKITKSTGEVLKYYNDHNGHRCRTISVVSNRGYQVRYSYPGPIWTEARNKITIINSAYEYCDPTALSCALSYEWPFIEFSSDQTAKVFSNQGGRQWKFWYNGLQSPGENGPGLNWTNQTYYPPNGYVGQMDWRTSSVTRQGQTWTYLYPNSDPILGSGVGRILQVVSPLGQTKRYLRTLATSGGDVTTGEFESPNLLTKVADESGNVTSFTYDGFSRLIQVELPEGNKHLATYDWAGNILTYSQRSKPGSLLADATTTYTYDGCCDRPLTVTDPNGDTTSYTYDPIHQGLVMEVGPAPHPGAAQPVKRYGYVQRRAWVKNVGGGYEQMADPIWLLHTERYCLTTATVNGACAGGGSDEVVITYDYGAQQGPNNLWIRGKSVSANGSVLWTCFRYDRVGNRISETHPKANLSHCE